MTPSCGATSGLAQVILGGLQFVLQGLELCLCGVDVFLAIAVAGQVVGRLSMGQGSRCRFGLGFRCIKVCLLMASPA